MRRTFLNVTAGLLFGMSGTAFAEVTTSFAPNTDQTSIAEFETHFVQLCLINQTELPVLVGTSWYGEAHHQLWVLPNQESVYRLVEQATEEQGCPSCEPKDLSVAFRQLGSGPEFSFETLSVPVSSEKSDACADLPSYVFKKEEENGQSVLKLVAGETL